MKVRELQQMLNKLDPDLPIVCYSEDDALLVGNRGFILFEVTGASTSRAEKLRLDDGTPYLKFSDDASAEVIAILEITSDF